LVAGCPAEGGGDDDVDGALPDGAAELSLYSVSPSRGPVGGGTTVELTGSGFDSSVAVYFGDEPAVAVQVADTGRLTCETPAAAGAGAVTVRVEAGDLSAQLIGGFTYEDTQEIDITWCSFQHPSATSTTVQVATEPLFGRVYAQSVTDSVGQGAGITGQVGFGPQGSDPSADSGWSWTDAVFNADADQVNDEYQASLTVAEAGDYDMAFRFNGGGKWIYCDLDGSDNGYTADQAAQLSVEEATEPMVDWCQVQWPAQLDATVGVETEAVYGRVFKLGVTEGPGAGQSIQGEAGYGPVGTHPGIDPGWVWVGADYNPDGPEDANDEMLASFVPQSPGEFDYAFRFNVDDGPWTYCDLNGTDDGYTSSFAGSMSVTGEATGLVDWCNLQYPASTQTTPGADSELIFGRVFSDGSTPGGGQGSGIMAQLGHGDAGSDPETDGSWQWVDATYNVSVDGLVPGDLANDEYMASLSVATEGAYDYAYRFSKDGGASWLYCDLDGSDNGYDTGQSGTLDVVTSTTPEIGSIVLAKGTALGGSQVTINGTGFDATPTVFFGGVEGVVQNASWDTISVVTPPHAPGLVDVTVESSTTESDTLQDGFEYILTATAVADGDLAEWDPLLLLAESTTATDATPGYLSTLYVAFDADNLYVGVQGLCDTDQSIVAYLDVDYGAGTGVGNAVDLSDNSGALDDAISGVLLIDDTGFGAEYAAGTVGMASVQSGLDDSAGWRGLSPANDLPWLEGTVATGSDVVELSIPLATLWPGGVDQQGATVAVVVKLLADAFGVDYSNQTLPEDSQGATVSSVAVFRIYPPTAY
jgi:hypothetical protein